MAEFYLFVKQPDKHGFDISSRTGSWPSKFRPGSIRLRPCFLPPHASKAAG
jgi:hypothetical protein